MKLTHVIGLAFLLSLWAMPLTAQEEKRGDLWEVQVLEVDPAKVMEFETMVKKIVQLANTNKVSPDYSWHFWSEGLNYIVANPLPNFASFDDPSAWMRQFGEEGSQQLAELFPRMEKEVGLRGTSREILEVVPTWNHTPENMGEFGYGTLYSFWVKPGHNEAFSELAGDFAKAWKQMEYPYMVSGYRTHFGNTAKVDFVVFYDHPAKFMGEHGFSETAQRAGQGEHYEKLLGKLMQHIDNMEISHMRYHPDLSYTGPGNASTSN